MDMYWEGDTELNNAAPPLSSLEMLLPQPHTILHLLMLNAFSSFIA